MANAYSLLNNFDAPLYSPDFQSISKALTYKQNKLDINRDALQQMYDNVTNLDIVKGVDKDYANKRIAAVTDLVNQYANQDLSNDGLAKSLQKDVSQILDKNVKNAVYSTALYRVEEQKWDKLKDEHPEKYHDVNYAYSKQNFNQYLNDPKVGSKYNGGGGVIEYSDVKADLNVALPKMLKEKGIYSRIDEDGSEYYYDVVKGQRVTADTVQLAMNAVLNDKHLKQLQINAWGKYDQLSDDAIKSRYTSNNAYKAKELETDIQKVRAFINDPNATPEDVSSYKEILVNLKGQKNQVNSLRFDPNSRQSIYTGLYMEDFTKTFTDAYTINKIESISRSPKWEEQKRMQHQFDIDKITTKAYLDASLKEQKTNTTTTAADKDKIAATKSGDNSSPSGLFPVETSTEGSTVGNVYNQLWQEKGQLVKSLEPLGILDGLNGTKEQQAEAQRTVLDFTGQKNANSFNKVDGTYEYVLGKDDKGESRKIRMTPEQAMNLYNLKQNTKQITETESLIENRFDKLASKMNKAVIDSEAVNYTSTIDYNMWATKDSDGSWKLGFKPDGAKTYADLIGKRKNGETLTEEEEENLKLYSQLNLSKSAELHSRSVGGETEGLGVSASESYLQTIKGRYKNGERFIPKDLNALEYNNSEVFYSISKKDAEKYNIPLYSPESIYKPVVDKIAEHYTNGNYIVVQDFYKRRGVGTSIPKEFLQIAERVVKSGNIAGYKFSEEDDKLINDMFSKHMVGAYGGGSDARFYDLGTGDLEKSFTKDRSTGNAILDFALNTAAPDVSTLEGGSSFEAQMKTNLESIDNDIVSNLSDFSKGNQNYYQSFDVDKTTLRKNLTQTLLNLDTGDEVYSVGDKGVVNISYVGDNAVIFGDLEKQYTDANGNIKKVKVIVPANRAINLGNKNLLKESTGIQENKLELTTFNTLNKNPSTEQITLEKGNISTDRAVSVVQRLNELEIAYNKQNGLPTQSLETMIIKNDIMDNMMSDVKLSLEPSQGTYVLNLKVPSINDKGEKQYRDIMLQDTEMTQVPTDFVFNAMGTFSNVDEILGNNDDIMMQVSEILYDNYKKMNTFQ